MRTINVAPTWGEWGKIFYLLAVSGERTRVEGLRPDFAKAMAVTQAFHAIQDSLTEEQQEKANAVFRAEMAKQGFSHVEQNGAASKSGG
jgi:hypothetical protein